MPDNFPPIVSIVMPVFNRAELMKGIIDSILQQDFDDFELLIINDGSTDHTEQVIRDIQAQDKRVNYHTLSENKGIGFARQTGLELISGKYMSLADSDDPWEQGKLGLQVSIMETHPEIDILFGDYLDVDYINNTRLKGFDLNLLGFKQLKTTIVDDHLWVIDSGVDRGILISNFIAVPTVLLRNSVFNKVGGFNANLPSGADHEFAFRAAVLGAKFAYLDLPLILRQRLADSKTANKIVSSQNVIRALGYCRELCISLQKKDLVLAVDQALHRTYNYLMLSYGQAGNKRGVINAYRQALSLGFSFYEFSQFFASLGGKNGIGMMRYLKRNFRTS